MYGVEWGRFFATLRGRVKSGSRRCRNVGPCYDRPGMRNLVVLALTLLASAGMAGRTCAEEGMWTFDAVPLERVEQAVGVRLEPSWLDHLRGAAARLTSGCSAAVVSAEGLLVTNQHCVLGCEESLSGTADDLMTSGFATDARAEERACPGLQVEILESIAEVTQSIFAASAGRSGQDFVKSREEAIGRAERVFCGGDRRLRCQVISFYGGGLFKVYKFRRFADVRLVFAPEFAVAFFGGDADNYSFPRADLDCAFLRLYEDGRPASTPDFLAWASAPPTAGEAVFVAGSPGATERGFTVDQLLTERDVVLPVSIRQHAALRDRLVAFGGQSPSRQRVAAPRLFEEENDLKVLRGRAAFLSNATFLAARTADEAALKARVALDPRLAAQIGDPWGEIDKLRGAFADDYLVWRELEKGAGGGSQLFAWARGLVRAAQERARPTAERLPEYADSRLPLIGKVLLDDRPVSPDLERLLLELWLEQTRDSLAGTPALTHGVLADAKPDALVRQLVEGTRLGDPNVRRALWEGGWAAVRRSNDPLITFVIATDPSARAARRSWEEDVQGPIDDASERIARVRFAVEGADLYPDATFSPRLSYGRIAGWRAKGSQLGPFTSLGDLFSRATGTVPYRLPLRWLLSAATLETDTVLNFLTTNDIAGGNSGSPVVNSRAEILGVAFDGNQASIGGEFTYDSAANRTIVVSTAAISEALAKVYGRSALLHELNAK